MGAPPSDVMLCVQVRFAVVVAACSAVLAGCSGGDDSTTLAPTGAGATGGSGATTSGGSGGKAGNSTGGVGGTTQSGGNAGSGGTGGSVSGGTGGTSGAGGGVPLPPEIEQAELLPAGIRRLTNEEFAASVTALLGVPLPADISLPPNARQDGFTRNAAQRVDPVLAKQLDAMAQALAANARPELQTLAPCSTPSGSDECASTFITSFGAKAYRRPLTQEEVDALLELYQVGLTGGSYAEGIELVIRGVLQSAGFLYITELGDGTASDPIALTPRELATSLSYLVTAQPPTDAFVARAEDGEFSTPEGRVQGAKDLLGTNDPARATVLRMMEEWLGVDRIVDTGKDLAAYPRWNDAVRASMAGELRAFVDSVVSSGGTVGDLIGADWTMVNSDLASLYGISFPGGTGFQRVSLADTGRRGILNQGAFLSVYAHASESAPVLRGVALLERIVCLPPDSPTSTDKEIPAPPQPDETNTTRERFEAIHSRDPWCAGCHSTIDALGFSFEHFDGMGMHRTRENNKDVNAATTVTADMGMGFTGDFANSEELALALSENAEVRACFARHLFRSAAAMSGPAVQPSEDAFVEAWRANPAAEPGSIVEAILAYAASPVFAYRRAQ
jgi:hypothetical protein